VSGQFLNTQQVIESSEVLLLLLKKVGARQVATSQLQADI